MKQQTNEFVGLKPKMYSYLVNDNSEYERRKGVNRNVVATISHNEYKDILFKGNTQFLFLCNPQKSGASQVCITFLQVTQKIQTKDIIQWLEVITEILSFLKIFSLRKTTTQFF